MKIADGVEMLELSASLMGNPSTYCPTLMWDEAEVILVDTGLPGMLPQLHKAFDQAGVAFERLNRIILTHHDIDHIGSLATLVRERDGQVQVMAYSAEITYINGEKRPLKLAQFEDKLEGLSEERKAIYEKMKIGFQNGFAPVNQGLADGQELPFCGGITIIFTPGHTLGHTCLYLQRHKILIAGDALRVENGTLQQTPPFMNYDMDLYHQSLQKLTKFQIETVICYHGGLFRDHPSQRIAELASMA